MLHHQCLGPAVKFSSLKYTRIRPSIVPCMNCTLQSLTEFSVGKAKSAYHICTPLEYTPLCAIYSIGIYLRLVTPRTTLMITQVCFSDPNYVTSGGQDYTGGNYSVILPAGSTKENFSIPITDDDIFETDETFFLTLVIPPPAQDIGVMRGVLFMCNVTIINDDGECSVISFPHTDTF